MNRRSLITGLISFVAAPAIVRASNIMPVKSFVDPQQILNEFLSQQFGYIDANSFVDIQTMMVRYTGKKILVELIPNIYEQMK